MPFVARYDEVGFGRFVLSARGGKTKAEARALGRTRTGGLIAGGSNGHAIAPNVRFKDPRLGTALGCDIAKAQMLAS